VRYVQAFKNKERIFDDLKLQAFTPIRFWGYLGTTDDGQFLFHIMTKNRYTYTYVYVYAHNSTRSYRFNFIFFLKHQHLFGNGPSLIISVASELLRKLGSLELLHLSFKCSLELFRSLFFRNNF